MMSGYVCIALICSVVALLVWWFAPILIVNRLSFTTDKDKADVEDSYRKTIGQAIGGAALIITFAWTFYKDRDAIYVARRQFKTQTDQFLLQQDQARDQFANQQFISAAGLLKEGSVSSRIAGLYAFEQIASAKQKQDARNPYLIPVIQAAIGFIKEPIKDTPHGHAVTADVQSAVTILAHLNEDRAVVVDLHGTNLVRADFRRPRSKAFAGSDFQGAVLYGADMSDLDLTDARFGGSFMDDSEAYGAEWVPSPEIYEATRKQFTVNFDGSTLANANFDHVHMGGASLVKSCVANVSFYLTDLSRAIFQGADMGGGANCGSNKNRAYFYKAVLVETNFDDVDVGDVSFVGANLTKTRFAKAKNISKAAFADACADTKPEFPANFDINLPPCQH
jgi:uncharacterized protein YjbI with pentapeptide repeats